MVILKIECYSIGPVQASFRAMPGNQAPQKLRVYN